MSTDTILVVEDDAALLEGLRDILEFAGYAVVTARNGLEGLQALSDTSPDLIVSDINMPRLDGYQFYAQVRARPELVSVPFIFLTAKSEKHDVRRGKLLGADDYVTKPFEEADLLVAVQAKLNRRAELRAAHERQIGDLKRSILTTLNHEFRTPLTYITTYADMLGESNVSAEEFRDFMRGIQAGSERLRRLVEDFILLVELQTGEAQRTFERRRVVLGDLPYVLRGVLEDYAARAEARRVQMIDEVTEPLPAVYADPDFLADAVGRLVDNGIKFTRREGGTLRLRAEPGGLGVRISVVDDGVGIRAGDLDKIFDVFHQIDRAKMEQQGSGSGLAIAQSIIAMHAGTISASSTPGEGSQFVIELPVWEGL
jgi:two-component system, sensor histidine kinase and response regulator